MREARRGGDSLLVSALTLFNVLRETRPDLAERLLKPMAHDRRGEVPAGQQPFFMIPVLSWHAQALTVFYQRQYIDSAQRFEGAHRVDERFPLGERRRRGVQGDRVATQGATLINQVR